MSRELIINYEGKPCYHITMQRDFASLGTCLRNLGYSRERKICIITDDQVFYHYADKVRNHLCTYFDKVYFFTFFSGEEQKHLGTIEAIYESLIEKQFDRKDLLIALGGGVTGDMCGYVAATYLRGIDFIQVPTSLLAQVDSSIGGKTGVDFKHYKNMIGAFKMPKLVYMNVSTLITLSDKHFSAGMAEILKHGFILDGSYLDWIHEHENAIRTRDLDVLEELIYRSCQIKGAVVERDPKEQGERALLNFGHTVGHAIEKQSNFRLIHGFGVSLGIVAAGYISMKRGFLSIDQFARIQQALEAFGLPVKYDIRDAKRILANTKLDKKMDAGKVRFVLLRDVGEAYIDPSVSDEEILDAIRYISK